MDCLQCGKADVNNDPTWLTPARPQSAPSDSSRPSTSRTSNTGGETARPVSAARRGCAILPSFSPLASACDLISVSIAAEVQSRSGNRRQNFQHSAFDARPSALRSFSSFVVRLDRPLRDNEERAADELGQASSNALSATGWRARICPIPWRQFALRDRRRSRHPEAGAEPRAPARRRSVAAAFGSAGAAARLEIEMRQHPAHVLGKLLVGGLTDIVPVQIIELLEVEPRRAFVDAVDVEPSNDVLRRHDLIVAVAPAEAHEIVA